MSIRVAINGFGRIGKNILRAHYEYKKHPEIEIVAINDTASLESNAHLTRYDTTHGKFPCSVATDENHLIVDGNKILFSSTRDPLQLPWRDLNIDIVCECTGAFTEKEKAAVYLGMGAKKVLISAPGKDVEKTIVYGVNDHILTASDTVVSNASCTTNCLAPIVKPLYEKIGIVNGLMTTIHAYTNDQRLLDGNHNDLRRARAAAQCMIPTKTGAAASVGLVLPELKGKLDGYAMRVPTLNVSVVDLTFVAERTTSVNEINQIMREAAQNEFADLIEYNEEPLVSVDFNHNPASAIFDATQTRVIGNTVKILAWYDNEWGFSNRMLDTMVAMIKTRN